MRLAKLFLILIAIVSYQLSTAQSCNITFNPVVTGTSCSNLCDGSVVLNPTGGTAPYTLNAFDHNFPGSGVDLSTFSVSSNAIYSVSNKVLTASPNPSASTSFNNAIYTNQSFPASGKFIAEASFYVDNSAFVYWGLTDNVTITSQNQFLLSFYLNNGNLFTINGTNVTSVGTYSASTWYDLKIEKIGTTVNYYIRQTGLSSYTQVSTQTTSVTVSNFKLAATYRNLFSTFGGFKSMNWKIGGNPPTTNLCPGTYSYTVYDAAGCYGSTNVIIGSGTGANSLTLGGSVTPASCSVASDGAINLNPTGGSGPYSFGLAQSFSGSTINNSMFEIRNGNFSQNNELREGINTSSNNGWDNSIATRQTFSDGGYLNFEGTFRFDESCDAAFGFTDSSAVNDLSKILVGFQITGGTSLYVTVNNQSLQRVATLTANTWYDFKIEKTGNVVNFYSRVNGTTNYSLTYTTRFPSAIIEYRFGVVNYSSYFSASAGYNTKNWNVLVTPKVTKLSVGTYTYTITDANGCTATTVFAVGQAVQPVSLTATLVNPTVLNGSTGEVSISPGGGNLPYKYQFEESFSDSLLNSGWFSVRNGYFTETNTLRSENVTNATWNNSISTNVLFTDGGLVSYTGSFKFDANARAAFGFTTNTSVINDPSQVVMGFTIDGTQLSGKAARSNSQVIGSISPDTWYDFKVEKTNGLVRFYMRNTGSGNYNLIYTIPYSDSLKIFRASLVVFGTSAGMNTKNWVINSNPPLTGLPVGTYAYTVYDMNGCYATATVTVPTVNRIAIIPQPVNSSAWNVCDGSVSFNNVPANSTIYNIAYQQSFSGTQIPSNEVTIKNGTYSVNGSLISSAVSGSGWNNSVTTTNSYTDNGYIAGEMDMQFASGSNVYFGLVNAGGNTNSYTDMAYAFYYSAGKFYVYTNAGQVLIGSASANTSYSFRIEKSGATVNFYIRTALDNDYQIVYTTNTSVSGISYKLGFINNSNSQTFNSKNWAVLNNSTMSGLCLGKYTYRVVSPGVSPVSVPVTINTNITLVSTLTAPANVTVSTNTGVAYATGINLGTPGINGSIAGITFTNNAPAQYPLGVTTVKWTATDEWGNTATVNQTVTVVDTEAPVVIAPANITINALLGQTSVTGIILGTAGATDNVGVVSITNNAPTSYSTGTTNVTWTATDAAGNSSTSVQKVIVIPTLIPTVTAPADVVVGTNAGKPFANNVNLGSPVLGGNAIGLIISNNAPAQYPLGVTTVTWTVLDALGNALTATQKVTVVDREAPTASATNLIVPTNSGASFATGVDLGIPVTGDNVGVTSVTNNAPAQYALGTNNVTWTIKDAAGNTTTGVQVVTVVDREAPAATPPANITVSTNSGVSFATGINLGTAVTNDNVAVTSVTNNAPLQYSLGANNVTWTIKDAAGNTTTAIQKVTVIDTEKPVASIANIVVPTNAGVSYATGVDLGKPTTSDNVGVVSTSNNAPTQYSLGANNVSWTIADAAGNITTLNQTVTVVGAPTIAAPAGMVVPSDEDEAFATITNLGTPTVSGYNYTVTNNGTGQYNIGVNTITWTVIDQFGRKATATQTITVAGPPTIASPADITIGVASGTSTVSNLNLGTANYYVYNNFSTPTNNAPSSYSVGTTNVVWSITDQWGRVASDVQQITVIVPPLPTITAPPSITVNADANQTYATISSLGTPNYYAFGSTGPTNNGISTGKYPVGTTYVTWTVIDQFGRKATATQTIIVVTTCTSYTVSIASVLNSSVQTGSGPNVIYLGYGAQATTLQVTVPSINGPYTFSWTGSTGLSNYTSAAPVFTPTKEGSYTFVVTAKNAKGCTSSSTVTICVKDTRVLDSKGAWDGKKVYVCHLPPGNVNNPQILSVSVNAVSAHVPLHGGDGLGKSCSQPCATNSLARGTVGIDEVHEEAEAFNVKAYPNPSVNTFSLMVKSTDQFTRITVKIMDAFGRTVQVFDNVTAGKEIKFGDKFSSGAYYAEVLQGGERKVIPLMKAK